MKNNTHRAMVLLICGLLAGACAKKMGSDVYTDSSTAGKVIEGRVINVRTVTVKAHDKLQQNTLGGVAGGAAGLAAGSQIGRGSGNIAADVGGALIGAVGGALLQDTLSTSQETEYLVKIDKKYLQEFHTLSKKIASNGKASVEQDMTSGTTIATKSDIVSIVQEPDSAIVKGTRVYIIYNDDRPRLVANSD